ncbi:L-gulonolactone oxidase-like, partial [Centruroides sculpturatus]|uniref:L-gulonolactone oxidase-like n=1 Tax=Centruroides sculpturatus TaxID=218467 RepID=UPI000C6D7873
MKLTASGISGVNFTNWSKTFSCVPELLFAPKTNDEIAQILALATDEKKHVRVVGCGHSPSDIACTEDYMISLQHMNKVVEVDEVNKQVKVQAGITLRDLNEIHLPKYKLALSVLGSVSDLTIGGAISTGTHGTGINFGNLCSYVIELEMMDHSGKFIRCSRSENKEIFLAAVCGLGAIGIILTVTLQCESAFNLEQRQFGTTLKDVLEHLDLHVNGSEHFKFTWFPHTDGVVVSHVNRTDKPVAEV